MGRRTTHRLRSRTLFNEFMKDWSVRALAEEARCGKSIIGDLRRGAVDTCSEDLARRITKAFGLERVEILFAPVSSTPVDNASGKAA